MEKESEKFIGDYYFKTYITNENYNLKNIMNCLINNGELTIKNITVNEDAELDMQIVSGIYKLDDFLKRQDYIASFDIIAYEILADYNNVEIKMIFRGIGNDIALITPDSSIEMFDILKINDLEK